MALKPDTSKTIKGTKYVRRSEIWYVEQPEQTQPAALRPVTPREQDLLESLTDAQPL